ncbi:TetR family transcriptional regulator [Nocardioides mangrovicus]|nr:TetR family transcriptional regulator [Nocardioides mangrovicus]
MDGGGGVREVARSAVRGEVLRVAWLLFGQQGFEATTIEQVAQAAGMSRRTFFRYFTGKDELILARLVDAGERVAALLAARPADEPVWTALRRSLDAVVVPQEVNGDAARRMLLLLEEEPAARSSMEERRRLWIETLTPHVAARLGPGRTAPMRAAAVCGAAIACLEAAQAQWSVTGEVDLGTLVDECMSSVAPLA